MGAPRKWTHEQLFAACVESVCYSDLLVRLGLRPAGGNYATLHKKIRELRIDTSHFRKGPWSKGRRDLPQRRFPLSQVLIENSWANTNDLKWRLINEGLKNGSCELCGWAQRSADGRLPLELDHINGIRNDNRIENLRVLCPNCHSLQPTHRGRNIGRREK